MAPVFGHGRLRLYLLKLLDESPRHGYELIRLLTDRFLGLYAPSAGTIYPRLKRLETEGLVTHDIVEGRKVYRLTDAGRDELRARTGELDGLEAEIGASVRDLASQVGDEVRQTARELHFELDQTARDMRRNRPGRSPPVWASFLSYLEQRGAHGPGGRLADAQPVDSPADHGDEQDFQRRLQDFRDQARDAVHDAVHDAVSEAEPGSSGLPASGTAAASERSSGVSAAQLRECTEVLSDALAQIRAILHRRGGPDLSD